MRFTSVSRSLLAHSLVWIALPYGLLAISLVVAGIVIYQQTVTALLVDRDRQLAVLAADSVSQGLEGYARVLEALAGNAELLSDSDAVRRAAIASTSSALGIFNAGVALTDENGVIRTFVSNEVTSALPLISNQDFFQSVRSQLAPSFSGVVTDPLTGEPMIIIAVPVFRQHAAFAGALLGAVQLRTSALKNLVNGLVVGASGSAYLVGHRGRVIYHLNAALIGVDFINRPSVSQVVLGRSGGLVWQVPGGESYVDGYAPISIAGWGLIVQESWEMAAAPTQAHFALLVLIAIFVTIIAMSLMWFGMRQITAPVQSIADQTTRLAAGDTIETIQHSQVKEVDALGHAFTRMAEQIATYREGLRRYVGAITESQEDERLRLSRELHDDTVQSLMAIGRRIEIYESSEQDAGRLAQLQELHAMVDDTVKGVRQISRDLRPLILDDLGIVPALRTLVRAAREGAGAVPLAKFQVSGDQKPLAPEQELAIYRITQETLNNVRRHAHATEVEVSLTYLPHAVNLDVVDNGIGFQAPPSIAELAQSGHFGLMSIQERVWAVGGALTIDAQPGRGTRLAVAVPIEL
ncbi:MAG: histidine kinase [Chloroflexi bacterium]|nr:histidine kinase [Chloroflexota bacterium]